MEPGINHHPFWAGAISEDGNLAYGYPGDSTPDSNSAAGIGSFPFDSTPGSLQAGTDAALKKADAENIYHVKPGETFTAPDGKTYRYADTIPDWSPAKPGYVDVYDPSHPPDKGGSFTYRQSSGKSDNGANTNTGDMGGEDVTPAPDPTSVAAADPEKQSEKPTDVLGPDFMLQQIRQQHPQYGHDDNDTILKALQDKYPAPIQQLRAIFPQYKDVKDSDLMEGVRRKFYPELSEKDFQEKIQPPNPVVAAVTDYFQQFQERDLWKNIAQSFHTGMGGLEKFPERAAEGLDWLAKQDWLKGALKPMPGAKGYEQGIRGGIKRLYEAGQEQAKRGKLEQSQLPNTPGIVGKTNAIAGQIIGGTPEAVVSFLPGVGPAAAVTIGMTYNAVTAFGDAQERGKDNSIGQALEAGGVRAVQQWILDTPRGRLLSGVYNAVLSMGDEQARKFMNGDPDNDVDRTAANGALSFVLGVISARGPKEQLPETSRIYFDKVEQARDDGNTEEALQLMDKGLLMLSNGDRNGLGQLMLNWRDDVIPMGNGPEGQKALMAPRGPRQTPTEPSGPVITRPYRTKEELRPLPYNPEAVRPSKLQKKEFDETSPELNRASVLEWQNQKITPGKVPPGWKEDTQSLPKAYRDLGYKHLTPPGGPKLLVSPDGEMHLGGQIPFIHEIEDAKTFDDKMTDQFYYSGFGAAPQMVSDLVMKELPRARAFAVKTIKPHTDVWHRAWDPENIGPIERQSGAVIAQQNAMYATERQRLMNDLIRKMKLENRMQFAYDKDRRQAFWKTKPDVKLKAYAEAADEGRTTHDPVVDKMLGIYRQGYEAIARMDEHFGINYSLRDTYLPHILENPADITKVEALIRQKRWGDPGFMKPREIDKLSTLHKFGFKLKTYNQEELFQMRLDASLRARSRVVALENYAKDGLAVPAKDLKGVSKGLQDQIMSQSTDVRSPNGTHYWVLNQADFMLHRAWDPVSREGLWGATQKFVLNPLNTLKQKTVGLRLGLSLYHQNHMLDISAASHLATIEAKWLAGKGTGKDLLDALGTVLKSMTYAGGVAEQFKITKGYSNLLAFYEGKLGFEQLTPEEQWQQQYQRMGGLSPVVSHERQAQFISMLNKRIPVAGRIADPIMRIGYAWLTAEPYQKWLFHRVIPSLKMSAFDHETEALLQKSPWLVNPENEPKLRLELRNIGKKVDVRFGEMDYNNLFWPKATKLVGQTFALSLGWTMGFWRTYVGSAHSLTDNAVHVDQIIKTVRDEGLRPVAQRFFTNELLYAGNYTALTSIKNLMITAIFGGPAAIAAMSIWDAVYPRVGTDNKGQPIRLRPPYWQGELGSIYQNWKQGGPMGVAWNYFKNKTQPALSELAQMAGNKDYRGTEIIGKHDGLANQMGEAGAFILSQTFSFSLEPILQNKPGTTWAEKILPFFGLPSAPAWTSRTEIENNIINAYAAKQGSRSNSRNAQERADARTELREALQSKDQKRIDEARDKAVKVGLSELSIKDTENTIDQTTGQRLLHNLDPEEQESLLRDMSPDERAKYLPFASGAVRDKSDETPH